MRLCRDKSTIRQEIKRNSNKRKSYSAENAIEFYKSLCKRVFSSEIIEFVKDKIINRLTIKWLPKKISAWLKLSMKF